MIGSRVKKIQAGMLFKKFYCHKCGSCLKKEERIFIAKRGTPEFKEYQLQNVSGIGDIKASNFTLMCPKCKEEREYDFQIVVDRAQKRLKKKILSEEEIGTGRRRADNKIKRLKRKNNIAISINIVFLICLIGLMYFIKSLEGRMIVVSLMLFLIFAIGYVVKNNNKEIKKLERGNDYIEKM